MALDTKYRPKSYDDVVGQEPIVKILRHIVLTGKGFSQSYLFAGHHGSGKTTLARILARALLCDLPTSQGDPCDQCDSCKSFLTTGSAEGFTEFDAATHSGKDDIRRLVEESEYATVSGKNRVYLIDEAHGLSPSALDALLKPMEDTIPGTDRKRLVCIFCTTEPESMKDTIASRCAPTFRIKPASPSQIGDRLAQVCEWEGVTYDRSVLDLIAEYFESHIRDCLKALEGISLLGQVSKENAITYLGLGRHSQYLEILEHLGNPSEMIRVLSELQTQIAPAQAYNKLSEAAMWAFRLSVSPFEPPAYWDKERLIRLSEKGPSLLGLVQVLSQRPSKPTWPMLVCDLLGGSGLIPQHQGIATVSLPTVQNPSRLGNIPSVNEVPKSKHIALDPRARAPKQAKPTLDKGGEVAPPKGTLSPQAFFDFLLVALKERLDGQAGRSDMGGG